MAASTTSTQGVADEPETRRGRKREGGRMTALLGAALWMLVYAYWALHDHDVR